MTVCHGVAVVGDVEGTNVGDLDGDRDGVLVGFVGEAEGARVGDLDGERDGARVGFVGELEGDADGFRVGDAEGDRVGVAEHEQRTGRNAVPHPVDVVVLAYWNSEPAVYPSVIVELVQPTHVFEDTAPAVVYPLHHNGAVPPVGSEMGLLEPKSSPPAADPTNPLHVIDVNPDPTFEY